MRIHNIFAMSLFFLMLALCLASINTGHFALDWKTIISERFLTEQSLHSVILFELRIPRTVMCILAGLALGLGGAGMQGLLRNPLAEPSVIGVSSAAAFGAVLIMILKLHLISVFFMPLGAITAAASSALCLIFISTRTHDSNTVLLVGVGISLIAGAGTSTLLSLSDNPYAINEIVFWMLGSLTDISMANVYVASPFVIIGAWLLVTTSNELDHFVLGDEVAASSGVDVKLLQNKIVIGTALAVGGITSAIGIIGFIGLISPHLVRPFVGNEPRLTLLWSPIVAIILMLTADILIRILPTSSELRLGIVTSLIGAPIFLYIVSKGRSSL